MYTFVTYNKQIATGRMQQYDDIKRTSVWQCHFIVHQHQLASIAGYLTINISLVAVLLHPCHDIINVEYQTDNLVYN